jgi:hypothetical protein
LKISPWARKICAEVKDPVPAQRYGMLRRFAAEKLVFFFTAATGTTEAAEKQDADSDGDDHCQECSNRE